jgi:transketolase
MEGAAMNDKLQGLLQGKGSRPYSAKELSALAAAMRLEIFDILRERQTGHWGGLSSALELTTALYFNRMDVRPEEPAWEDRDRFVLSKGHASLNIYTVLAHRGFFPVGDLTGFRTLGSHLQGHPSMHKTRGSTCRPVPWATGFRWGGHGVGRPAFPKALLDVRDDRRGLPERRADLGGRHDGCQIPPERLVLMIDYNRVQLDGTSSDIMPLDPLPDKLKAFGWNVAERSYDGHDTADILASFAWMDAGGPWPKAVVYRTVKGKGVSFMEGKSTWHGAPIDDKSFAEGRPQLVADLEKKEAVL